MVIEVSGLTKHYADLAVLSNVSFSVRENEILGIIGPNGAGKTTLLECLAGLLPHDGGEVSWQGGPLAAAWRKKVLFYLPDGILPDNDQPSGGVLTFYREVFGAPAAREWQVVTQLGLAPVLTKRVDALSKGYRRRLLLAIALLAPQPLLLLDEPFDGFDLRLTLGVMTLLRKLAQSRRTLVLSIHQFADAERICDRLLLLDAGRVLAIGTLDELRELAGGHTLTLEEVVLALT